MGKRFTLYAPWVSDYLYPRPFPPESDAYSGRPIYESRVGSGIDPDLTRFPEFPKAAAVALHANLGPGDCIYIPAGWWHEVFTDEAEGALSVNHWFPCSATEQPPPTFGLLQQSRERGEERDEVEG